MTKIATPAAVTECRYNDPSVGILPMPLRWAKETKKSKQIKNIFTKFMTQKRKAVYPFIPAQPPTFPHHSRN
jgi:hypothetical protein